MSALEVSLLRLKVVAEADPGAVARVLERFENLNLLPRRSITEFGIDDTIHIRVDVCGLPEEQLKIIAAKIGQATSVVTAHWHRV